MAPFKKLLIMLLNVEVDDPTKVSAPFFQAVAAVSLGYQVSMVLNGGAGRLARKGVAETMPVGGDNSRTVYDYIQEAHRAGVRIAVCSHSLQANGVAVDELIPECREVIGSAAYVEMAMDEETQVLTY